MNHCSSRHQISSLATRSSTPCSRLGLSLTSMTATPSARLLDVDAVEPVADRARRRERRVEHVRRRVGEREGAEAALLGAVRPVFDDLPMAARHLILADEQRLAVEHADAPVEIGRHEFLREQEIGVLEQPLGQVLQLREILDLMHAARERAVGNLDHHRPAQRGLGLACRSSSSASITVGGDRHAVRLHQLVQIDLVGAADHRGGIVDDRHAFLQRAAGEAIGVIVDRGRRANEQAVVFGEFGELLARDQFDLDRMAFGEFLEVAQASPSRRAAASPAGRAARRANIWRARARADCASRAGCADAAPRGKTPRPRRRAWPAAARAAGRSSKVRRA